MGFFSYQETQVRPLVEEVSVDVDAVGLGQVFRYQLPDLRQVLGFLARIVGYITDVRLLIMAHCAYRRTLIERKL